ncbi:MAG: peptidoglycan DD-metalloendopeptidase family protein [Flavobacteriales bacterium]|nr:peptidoglycan DD-metalloendopeptidase family protein [Flavobacteriales bacterium]
MMEFASRMAVPLVLWASLLPAAFAQEEGIGGPVDSSSYEETGAGLVVDETTAPDWTAADSSFHFPAYETYGDWNTDQIFERRPAVTDTINLQLGWANCDHAMPVHGRITSPFGMRHGRHHYGTDIKLQTGDTVLSAFEGKVRISRYHRDFGYVVVVRHPNGLETLYGHLSKCLAQVGDEVQAGDVLGLGGSTGRSTGSHLHFETRYLGHPIDPAKVFDLEAGKLRSNSFLVTPKAFQVPASGPARYRVRKGDTLYAISRRSGVPVARLCKINRIKASSTLRVGQSLRLR